VGFGPDLTPPAPATSPQPLYYVAMGDSLAAGTGASTPASGYVNPLLQQRQHPRERQWTRPGGRGIRAGCRRIPHRESPTSETGPGAAIVGAVACLGGHRHGTDEGPPTQSRLIDCPDDTASLRCALERLVRTNSPDRHPQGPQVRTSSVARSLHIAEIGPSVAGKERGNEPATGTAATAAPSVKGDSIE